MMGRFASPAKRGGMVVTCWRPQSGELDEAEAMQRKALEINETLGRLEGMAIQYSNLGNICKDRSDADGARENWIKARDLYMRAQIRHEAKEMQGWIDGLEESE